MKRRLKFQFITDSRFCPDIYREIQELNEKLERVCQYLPIKIWSPGPRKVYFNDSEQYRSDWIIEKTGKITWNQIMKAVNTIQAPYYRYI